MRLALYCRLPEQNFWKTRLLSVLDSMKVTIQAFAELSAWRAHAAAYSGAVVVVDGPDGLTAVRTLREEGYRMILAAECMPGSRFAWEMKYEFPLAIVFGNEALGVAPETLELVDGLVSLPMFGEKSSINVGNSAAAILYAVIAATRYGVHV